MFHSVKQKVSNYVVLYLNNLISWPTEDDWQIVHEEQRRGVSSAEKGLLQGMDPERQ